MKFTSLLVVLLLALTAVLGSPEPFKKKGKKFGKKFGGFARPRVHVVPIPVFHGGGHGGFHRGFHGGFHGY